MCLTVLECDGISPGNTFFAFFLEIVHLSFDCSKKLNLAGKHVLYEILKIKKVLKAVEKIILPIFLFYIFDFVSYHNLKYLLWNCITACFSCPSVTFLGLATVALV